MIHSKLFSQLIICITVYQQGNGPYNIFILDTSSRLGEDGFQEMKEIFASMIDGNI